jgi:hypothetical protein
MIVTTQSAALLWQPPKPLATARPATRASAIAPSSRPASEASTEPVSKPALGEPTWIAASDPTAAVDQGGVQELLAQFDPLRAEKYLEKRPASPTAELYIVELGLADGTAQKWEFTKPVDDSNPYSTRDGLYFEVSPALTNALDAQLPGSGK